jgi:hypothetical protein
LAFLLHGLSHIKIISVSFFGVSWNVRQCFCISSAMLSLDIGKDPVIEEDQLFSHSKIQRFSLSL